MTPAVMSSPRKRGSCPSWTPAFAGMTILILASAIPGLSPSLQAETLYSDTPRTTYGSNPYSVESGSPLMTRMEQLLPVFVQVFDERLALLIEAVGEDHLTRKYTDAEFQDMVVQRVKEMLPGQLSDIAVQIHPDGIVGKGTARVESRSIPVQVRARVTVANDRLHLIFEEVQVGNRTAPEEVRKLLETHVNEKLDRLKLLLKIKWVNLGEGWALLSVELAHAV